jgi:peptidoglycan/LPS O-acetylase OafA/YrhL
MPAVLDRVDARAPTPDIRKLRPNPALDGLRGLALVAVLYRHLPTEAGPLGFGSVAVCTFFALSGFLITALLLQEWERHGHIDLREFYRRRAARLLPAALVVLPIVAVLYLLILHQDLHRAAVLSGLFVGNLAILRDEPLTVLNHTWTLAVEAHFYVLWPLVFLAVRRRVSARAAFLVTVGLAALVVLWRTAAWLGASDLVWWSEQGPTLYVLRATETRVDALLVGCAAAFVYVYTRVRVPAGAAVLALLAMVPFGYAGPASGRMVLGGFLVVPIAAAVVILHLATTESALGRFFGLRPLAALGIISYGVYLWHLPIYGLVFGQLDDIPLGEGALIAITLTLVVATASYFVVERPFLRYRAPRLAAAARVAPPS